jgi:hypothetical protein
LAILLDGDLAGVQDQGEGKIYLELYADLTFQNAKNPSNVPQLSITSTTVLSASNQQKRELLTRIALKSVSVPYFLRKSLVTDAEQFSTLHTAPTNARHPKSGPHSSRLLDHLI